MKKLNEIYPNRENGVVLVTDYVYDLKPDDYQAWYNRGTALLNLGRYEEAIASYDEALKFKPESKEEVGAPKQLTLDL